MISDINWLISAWKAKVSAPSAGASAMVVWWSAVCWKRRWLLKSLAALFVLYREPPKRSKAEDAGPPKKNAGSSFFETKAIVLHGYCLRLVVVILLLYVPRALP